MKKTLLALLIAALSFSAFAKSASVVSVKGKVEVERSGSWVALKAGDSVDESEVISTGFQSEAVIKFNDSVLQLAPLSRVTLSKMASSEKRDVVDVYLNTGAVRAKVDHSDSKKINYTVRNPVAVASVRGTLFDFMSNGTTFCYTGAVAVAPARFYKGKIAIAAALADIKEPEDGESDATTEATDVDPYSPAGATLVAQGQSTTIAADGLAATTFSSAVSQATSAVTAVQTAASAESVSSSAAAAAAAGVSTAAVEKAIETNSVVTITAILTGSLSASISWGE